MPVTSSIAFDAAWVFGPGALLILALLEVMAWRLSQRGVTRLEITALVGLRGIVLLVILFLAARPVTVASVGQPSAPYVAVLLDRSLSMSLPEANVPRYTQASEFLK